MLLSPFYPQRAPDKHLPVHFVYSSFHFPLTPSSFLRLLRLLSTSPLVPSCSQPWDLLTSEVVNEADTTSDQRPLTFYKHASLTL